VEFAVHEDRLKTVAINHSAITDHALQTVAPGRLWIATAVFVQTEGTVDLTFKSGATAITGPIALATAALSTFYWTNAGSPIFRSRAAGDDLVMTLTAGGPIQVNGWISFIITDSRNV
jgi:hypothetical protein